MVNNSFRNFMKSSEGKVVKMVKGISRKTLAYSDKQMVVEFTFGKGSSTPHHSHPHEQIGYLVKGKVRYRIGNKEETIESGDSFYVPSNVDHANWALEETVAIEVFCPPREDYK